MGSFGTSHCCWVFAHEQLDQGQKNPPGAALLSCTQYIPHTSPHPEHPMPSQNTSIFPREGCTFMPGRAASMPHTAGSVQPPLKYSAFFPASPPQPLQCQACLWVPLLQVPGKLFISSALGTTPALLPNLSPESNHASPLRHPSCWQRTLGLIPTAGAPSWAEGWQGIWREPCRGLGAKQQLQIGGQCQATKGASSGV